MSATGSVWQKWDLHIHTPESFHWNGERFENMTEAQRDEACASIIDKINSVDVIAFGIMDYWTFDGFIRIRDFLRRNPKATTKRIFPGIELRMVSPTPHRLNTHVLLDDSVDDDDLRAFVSTLKLAGEGKKPPTRSHLIEVGRQFGAGTLRDLYGKDTSARYDEAKMLEVGQKSAEITQRSLEDAVELIGKGRCLIIQPYDTSGGLEKLDWKTHPYADSILLKLADCFESRNPISVSLFLGQGHPTKPHVGPEFIESIGGYPKPVFAGSDAHRVSDYGKYPSNRATWIKAQPTFRGLKHVCHEPALRCYVGERPAKLDHIQGNPTKYIRSVKLSKVEGSGLPETWFDGQEIPLNPGLIAVIGNKGSGKSALADILALAGNAHCPRMEFLNNRRFRHGENKAKHFNATIEWCDGSSISVCLDHNPVLQNPERVRYLPQHFIEELCNEIAAGNENEFSKELRKVIFLRIPEEERLSLATLDELLEYLIEANKTAIQQLQQRLHTLNESIARLENESSASNLTLYSSELKLKESELAAHLATKPAEKQKPVADPNDEKSKNAILAIGSKASLLESVNEQIRSLKEERSTLTAEGSRLTRLVAHVGNFAKYHDDFVVEHGREFDLAGFSIDEIVSVKINHDPLKSRRDAVAERLEGIRALLENKPAEGDTPAESGLETRAADLGAEIQGLREQLNAPEKEYQEYLAELIEWEARGAEIIGAVDKVATIGYLKDRIRQIVEVIPAQLEALRHERFELVRKIHGELLAVRRIYEKLYEPIQRFATEIAGVNEAADALSLQFNAYVSCTKFQGTFLEFINKGRRGSFYGDDESHKVVGELVGKCDFNNTEDVIGFTSSIYSALTQYDRNGTLEKHSIESQLKQNKTVVELYDYLFGLGYLDVRFTLRLGDKDISQLSPGEKGALLLVFYLMLDSEEIPIIIDQPEHNLDNESVVRLLVSCIRNARVRRQVIVVTHNPNLAVYCDADQVICCGLDKTNGHKITYTSGAIEDYEINQVSVNVLEGTYEAFDNRRRKYQKPEVDYSVREKPRSGLPFLGPVH